MKQRPGSEFYKLFTSFLVLLLLPLILFGSLYLRSVANTRADAAALVENSLSRDGALIDARLSELSRRAGSLVTSEELRSCNQIVQAPRAEEMFRFILLQNEILGMISADADISEAYVWFPKGSYCLSNVARFPEGQLDYMAEYHFNSDLQQVLEQCFERPTGFHLFTGGQMQSELIYVQHTAVAKDAPVLLLRLRNSLLEHLTDGESPEERRMVELDGICCTASLNRTTALDWESARPFRESDSAWRMTCDGEECLVVCRDSAFRGLRFLSAIPERALRQQSRYILRTAFLFAVLYLTAGAMIAWLFARQRYSPLKKIMTALSLEDAGSGEYTQIEQRFRELNQRSEQAESVLETSRETIRAAFLRRLLRGDADPELAASFGVDFGEDQDFSILRFTVSDYGPQFAGQGEVDDRTSEVLLYSVQNVADESARCRCYSFAQGEQVVSILSAPTAELPASEPERIARNTAGFFLEKLEVKLTAQCSGPVRSVQELAGLWRDPSSWHGISLGGEEQTVQTAVPQNDERQISAILRYTAEHCCEGDFSLGAVAERFGISTSYLSRRFKSEAGVGFGEYMQSLRFERAKELLRSTDLPVAQVAEAVGYFSVSAFTTAFRKAVGASPAAWRAK